MISITSGALLAAGFVLGGGWYYAHQMLPAPTSRVRVLDRTVEVRDGVVALDADVRSCLEVVGLRLADESFLQLSGPVERCDGKVERRAEVLRPAPSPPVTADHGAEQAARLDEYAWPDTDPAAAGLTFEEVTVQTPLGPAPAWSFPGERDTWVVFVHGRSANRNEANRLARITTALGYPGLAITYRNDGEAPATDDRVGHFGATEWEDLAAAVDHALSHGARDVVLAGFSQGGSLVGFHLAERPDVPVRGVILDAPLLDLPATLVQQARLRSIPSPLIPPLLFGTRIVARVQADFDPWAVDHVAGAESWPDVPVLLFHGVVDDFVPVGPSDRLAEHLGEGVTYHRVPDAAHVEAWNADPEAYEAAVTSFLAVLD